MSNKYIDSSDKWGGAECAPAPMRTLDRLSNALRNIEDVNERIDNLLGRFTGNGNDCGPCRPSSDSYVTTICIMETEVDRLAKLVDELSQHA